MLYIKGADSGSWLSADDLSQRLSALRARRATVEGAGHHPHLERPETLAQLVLEFLSG